MTNKPFFSVIIPTLNEEKYLPTILKSLSKQTYRDFEVIVVDGMSEDKTAAVFEKHKSLMPKASYYESNKRNVAYQRNWGAKYASGKFLVFFDADINIEVTFLEEIHIMAIKKKFQLATTWIAPDSKRSTDEALLLIGNLVMELAKGLNRPFSGGYNTIVKKEVFVGLKGFREDIKISEDHDFSIRAKKQGIDIFIMKEPQVIWSLRRYRSEGTLQVLRKYAQVTSYFLLKGPITKEIIDYPMGGHAHRARKKRKINLAKLDTYIQGLRKIENKMLNLFEE